MARTYCLSSLLVATADNIASIEIAQAGTIRQVQIMTAPDLDADGELYMAEVSLVPYMVGSTNDSVGCVAVVGERTSAAAGASGVNVSYPCGCPIRNGDRLYLNAILTGTGAVEFTALITVV